MTLVLNRENGADSKCCVGYVPRARLVDKYGSGQDCARYFIQHSESTIRIRTLTCANCLQCFDGCEPVKGLLAQQFRPFPTLPRPKAVSPIPAASMAGLYKHSSLKDTSDQASTQDVQRGPIPQRRGSGFRSFTNRFHLPSIFSNQRAQDVPSIRRYVHFKPLESPMFTSKVSADCDNLTRSPLRWSQRVRNSPVRTPEERWRGAGDLPQDIAPQAS